MSLSRRQFHKLMAGVSLAPGLQIIAAQAEAGDGFVHGLSLFGELKYEPNFSHFDYVRKDAPKGGRIRLFAIGSFDSLNPYSYKGDAFGGAANNETLLTSALDEPSSEYGLIASGVKHAADYSTVTFKLRPQARFHDGSPITPEDVIWSLEALKASHPAYNFYYKNVEKGEQTGDHEVTLIFSEKGNRELPQISGQLPILPKAWWTSAGKDGKARDIAATSLDIPLGSGPYQCVEMKPGDFVRLERVKDYWGADLAVNVGQNNFDEISYRFFKDETVALEAFKAGQYDFRIESSAKNWATGYDFPAQRDGKVLLEKVPNKNGTGMQSYAFNIRRPQFKDARVRQAFNLAFNYEWANENLFYGQYKRTASYFSNSELASTGVLTDPLEISILESLKDQVPGEVFREEYKNPVNKTPQEQRSNLRLAARLLSEAGWEQERKNGKTVLVNEQGEELKAEFLLNSPLFERITLPYVQDLAKLGIQANVRTIDSAQYQERVANFDFDIIVGSWGQSLSPGNEQRSFWGSEAANQSGSRNYVGIQDAAIDKLIEQIIFAKDRTELVAATRALDRVLLWHHFVVPMWHLPYARIAYWNRFGHPDPLPDFALGLPEIWWYEEDKAAATDAG